MTQTLLLLRHGETDGNLNRIVQTADTPLNPTGLRQADLAARRIVNEFGPKLVIRASDYTRAHQTAAAVASKAGVDIESDPFLRERNLGNLRGRAYADLGFDPFGPDYHPPQGESWQQFFDRVATLWQEIPTHLKRVPKDHALLVVTHGLVLRALALHHLQKDTVEFPAGVGSNDPLADHWPNTSLIALHDAGTQRWTAIAFNCARHLETETDNTGGVA